ncbi:iron(III) transport system permease protein [Singulisphaera sp. GP187]|uniref:ABC transporter permease n=1 Tax=Singulisphaera sp. GP187 TaxID=1882752 RepID=UPI00092A8063|nr:iron ABC transporter permease [Singulisphaera sp. GP187]SIN77327.1 iron(III) transport system permease protein [Singulisphaera sp. GP187]
MRTPKPVVAAAILLAFAVVLSPLLAALVGTGLQGRAMAAAFDGIAGPLGGSARSALVGALVALILGVPFALLVERSRAGFRRVSWTLGLLVLMMPPYLVCEAAIVLLGPAGKIARPAATLLGFGPRSTDPIAVARFTIPGFIYSWPAVGVVMGGCLFPVVSLAVAGAYRRTDHRVFESARLAQGRRGVSKIGAFIFVPPALGAALLVFALTLTEFAVPQLLRVRTVSEAIFERIQEGDLAAAAALSLPLLPVVVAAAALGAYMLARSRVASLAGLEGEVPKFTGRRLGRVGHLAAGLATLLAITPGLILPCVSLGWLAATARMSQSAMRGRHKLLRTSGILNSLRGAWELAHDDAIRTVLLAGLAATLATLFATGLARLASRVGWGPVLGVLGAGVAVPAPIVGLGLIVLWNRGVGTVVYQSSAIVVLAWFARFFPVAVFLAQGALARVPRELESAAALAGRGPIGRFFAVVLPNAAPGLAAAWLAIYVLAATEYGATVLIAPPGKSLLAPTVMNFMRRGQDPEIAACQILLLGVIALPLALIALGMVLRSRFRPVAKGSP